MATNNHSDDVPGWERPLSERHAIWGKARDVPCLPCCQDMASGKGNDCTNCWVSPLLEDPILVADCLSCYKNRRECIALPSRAASAADVLRFGRNWGQGPAGESNTELAADFHEALGDEDAADKGPRFAWGSPAPSPVPSFDWSDVTSNVAFGIQALPNVKPTQKAEVDPQTWGGTWGMPNADYTPSTSSASVQSAGDNVSYKAPVAKSVDSDEPVEEKPARQGWGSYPSSSYAASNNSVHSTVPYSLRSAINFDSWGFPVAQIKNKVNHSAATCDPEQPLANTDVDMVEHNRLINENMRLIDDYKRLFEDHQEKADENKRVVDDYKRLTEEVKQMAKNYERMASDFRSMASDFQLMAMKYSSMMEEKSAAAKEKKIRNDQIMALLE